jgi:hypothetical protein
MRAVRVTSLGGPQSVELVDIAEPAEPADAVVVDVHAAGVAFPDTLLTRGLYQYRPELPFTLGAELAGVVRSAPEGAHVREGDRVAGLTMIGGAMADTAVLPAGPIRDLFEECDAAIRTFAPAAIPAPVQAAADGGDAVADEAGAAGEGGGGRPGAPTSRAEALSQLDSIADFFERHDPHSLIGAQIRSVVRLGRLPREAYYRELLRDESALALLFRAAGMDGDGGG